MLVLLIGFFCLRIMVAVKAVLTKVAYFACVWIPISNDPRFFTPWISGLFPNAIPLSHRFVRPTWIEYAEPSRQFGWQGLPSSRLLLSPVPTGTSRLDLPMAADTAGQALRVPPIETGGKTPPSETAPFFQKEVSAQRCHLQFILFCSLFARVVVSVHVVRAALCVTPLRFTAGGYVSDFPTFVGISR